MNKICTSIEQSKKLMELGIDVKTADMYWWYNGQRYYAETIEHNDFQKSDIPAWSLAALFDALPEGVIENYNAPNLQKENGKYSIAYGNEELLCVADNPLDACYEMILKLHELKML